MRRLPLLSWVACVDSGRRLLRAAWAIQILGLLLGTAPLQAVGQEIHGEVRAKGVSIAVAGADVRLLGADSTLKGERYSDEHGGFVFKHLSPGPYAIRVTAPGFARQVEGHVLVRQNEVVNVTAWLDPQPITIPKLEVKARRRDYAFLRLHIGMNVQSLKPADVAVGVRLEKEKVGSYTLSDVLRKQNIPGLVISEWSWPSTLGPDFSPIGGPCFQVRGAIGLTGQPICAAVYLDGVPIDPIQIWNIEVEDIGAIVVLDADEAGVLYGTGSSGGAVLVYTLYAMQGRPR